MGIEQSVKNQELVDKLDYAFRLMTLDSEFHLMPEFKKISWNKFKQNLHKSVVHLNHNIPLLKEAFNQDLSPIIESIVHNPSIFILKYVPQVSEEYKKTFDKVPKIILKYVDKEYVELDIKTHSFKYGSIGEYRNGERGDENECNMLSIIDSEKMDQMERMEARVMNNYLENEKIDFVSLINRVDRKIQYDCFIGSYTEIIDSDYMWQEYAHDDGACIELETTGLKLYKVVYQDYLEQYNLISGEYRKLMKLMAERDYDDLKPQLRVFFERLITLSLLCFYRKDEKENYPKEGEWREIIFRRDDLTVRKTKDGKWDFAIVSPPGKILRVVSRMPEIQNAELEKISNNTIEIIRDKQK